MQYRIAVIADPGEFEGRRVLVTGGTKGIGHAILNSFHASRG
jgi:NAD(P)-dependent dehydrogenase (short-subunit alcohol dehydrogenase family)